MIITCPEEFMYDDLKKDSYTEAAFAGNKFAGSLLNQCNVGEECLFSTTESVEIVNTNEENAEMYVSRYIDLPVYLKCLDTEGFGPSIANMLIKALDEYFELYIENALTEKITAQVPYSHVYGYASPYKSDRHHCAHGPYYADGNLVNQVRDYDGILVTKFTYGFDVIWFKPQDCDQELLPDITEMLNDVFIDQDFLLFVNDKYPELDFIRNSTFCNVIDPKSIQVTLTPTTAPSVLVLENGQRCDSNDQCISGYCHAENGVCSCNIDTNSGCFDEQVCRYSCAYTAKEPRCYNDDLVRDCQVQWGPGYACADGNGDGIVDVLDKNSGCNYSPPTSAPVETFNITLAPLPPIETISPSVESTSVAPTPYPSIKVFSTQPTIITSNATSIAPTASQVETYAPSAKDSPVPTPSPSYGNTETVGAGKTLSPTMFEQAITESPIATLDTTGHPTDESKCDQKCVVYPDDTKPDECPIATVGTCGGGNRGDVIW